MTIREALREGTALLQKAGVPDADVDACLLLANLLKEDTLIVVEASIKTSFDYLEELGFSMEKLKTYKTNVHAFIRKREF